LVYNDPDGIKQYLARFDDGEEVEMTIGKRFKARTSGQPGEDTNFNGYYWAVIIKMISDATGELGDDDEIHLLLQMMFNKKGISVIDPKTKVIINVEVPRGTSNLSGAEFADFCSKCRIWAAIPGNVTEHGIYIPEPHEILIEE
jgi:hypothetical protein